MLGQRLILGRQTLGIRVPVPFPGHVGVTSGSLMFFPLSPSEALVLCWNNLKAVSRKLALVEKVCSLNVHCASTLYFFHVSVWP